MTRIIRVQVVLWFLAVAGWMSPIPVQAHTLGIDPVELTELKGGSYALDAKVPPKLQAAINTPELPDRCIFDGNPRGNRGVTGVRFEFSCDPQLTTDDTLRLPWTREGVLLTATWKDGSSTTRMVSRDGEAIVIALSEFSAGSGSFFGAAHRYTLLGIEHILLGVDHLLFVLALLLIVGGGWRLVKTITAFTVAHSITLGLATLGYMHLPPGPVEASIALSIAYLCVEIVYARSGRQGLTYASPWLAAFAFGLLHGLGFAGALSEIGLPASETPVALLFFNIGVEIGQLMFVAVVLAMIFVLKRLFASIPDAARLEQTIGMFAVYCIGTIATYWFIERTLQMLGVG